MTKQIKKLDLVARLAQAVLREPNNPSAQKDLQDALLHAGYSSTSMPAPLSDEERAGHEARVFEERAKIYGEATFCHGNLGLYFTALIQQHYDITLPHPIPSDLAMMMIAANKLNRMARPSAYHEDNFVDMRVYTGMAERAQRKRLGTGGGA